MLMANEWKDYEIIDCSNGMKLERWKDIYLLRPDPHNNSPLQIFIISSPYII